MQTVQESTFTTKNSSPLLLEITSSEKYGGLIARKKINHIRNLVFNLLIHIDSILLPNYGFHSIISFFRLMMYFGPSFFVSYGSFWKEGTSVYKTVSTMSVLFHAFPVDKRQDVALYFIIGSSLFSVFVLLMIVFFSLQYHRTSKIGSFVPRLMEVSITLMVNISIPLGIQYAGETLSYLLSKSTTLSQIYIISSIFCVGVAILVLYLNFQMFTSSLVFRPTALITIFSDPQCFITLNTVFVTLISSIGSKLKEPYNLFCVGLTGFFYILGMIITFMIGTFVESSHKKFYFAISISGFLNSIIFVTFSILKVNITEGIMFGIIFTIPLFYFVANIIFQNRFISNLRVLDQWMDDPKSLDECDDYSLAMKCAIDGMHISHPVSIDWSVFKMITANWPQKIESWIVFAKFVSIFPEESSLLSYIVQQIINAKLKGSFSKQNTMHILALLQQRESNLSPLLKHKIDHVRRAIASAKRNMRNVWDQVIQGNLDEMDSSVSSTFDSVSRSTAELNHLMSEYPNNRFVARLYSQYAGEVLADFSEKNLWKERINLIKRGVTILDDQAHKFGLHYFPKLPESKQNSRSIYNDTQTESNVMTDIDMDDEQVENNSTTLSVIKNRIMSLSYPSIRFSNIFIIVCSVLFIIPVVFVLLYSQPFIEEVSKPLNIIYHTSLLRSLNFQIPAFIHHLILENSPIGNPLFDKVDLGGYLPKSLGSTSDTRAQIQYLVKMTSSSLQSLSAYRSFGNGDANYEKAQSIIFGQTTLYTQYLASNAAMATNTSIQLLMLDYIMQATKATEIAVLYEGLLNNTILLNPALNCAPIAAQMSTALTLLVQIMNDAIQLNLLQILYIEIAFPIVLFLVIFASFSYSVFLIHRDKKEVYKCLMSIPKNIVSSLSDNLRILKKEKTDSSKRKDSDKDMSKQEENILKVFASASDISSHNMTDSIVFVLTGAILFICVLGSTLILANLYNKMCSLLLQNAPHLDFILGTSGYIVGMFMGLNNCAATINGYKTGDFDPYELARRAVFRIDTFRSYYTIVRYGDESKNIDPFPQFEDEIGAVDERRGCTNVNRTVPQTMREIYDCYSPSLQILLVETWAQHMMLGYLSGKYNTFNTHGELFNELWYMVAFNLYEHFLFPMFESIIPTIEKTIQSSINPSIIPTTLIIGVWVFCVVILLYKNNQTKKQITFALSLLLHCPSETLLHTPKIMNVLSGSLESSATESSRRDSEFFDQIVENLPDMIVIVDSQFLVVSMNNSFQKMFNVNTSFIGTDIRDFLSKSEFDPSIQSCSNSSIQQCKIPEIIKYRSQDGSYLHFRFTTSAVSHYMVISIRNETQVVSYNNLISEERAKSEKMLHSILPPAFVSSLQSGQKNIGFLVQSATVLFIDIVSFTPWCASLTAQQVMSTLNMLFRNLDSLIAQYPTMTKVKCIGDCYMAAGGIFSDSTNPSVHAKECVEFSLDAINSIERINKENNLKLQIRIGIHTGGPVVAGVIGTKKPTFEILGPSISMAQQMEHHGVPMNVHISRSVYELVFGGVFTIKERGETLIKDKKILTYLVTGR